MDSHCIEILDFINRRFKKDCDWTTGNCYWFAKILCDRFNYLRICYNPVTGHFIAEDFTTQECYDFNGVYQSTEQRYPLEMIQKLDTDWYNRLVRDCVN